MRKSLRMVFKSFCCLLLLAGIGLLPVKAQRLKKIVPAVKVFKTNDGQIFQASDVTSKTVKMLAATSLETLKTESFPTIYKVPLSSNLYLVTVIRSDDTQSELVLFRQENDRLREISRSSAFENAVTGVTFFVGGKSVLIVADTAVPPDFTKLEIVELKNEQLTSFGKLEIAEKSKPSGLHNDFVSPAEKAIVEIKSGNYYITFRGNLYSDWGGDAGEETKISSPATFYSDKTARSFKVRSKK